ncbi:MAG TPA: phosphotransferase [Ktedonobacteraceae bacterium]
MQQAQLEVISSYFGLGPVLLQQRIGGHANENYLVTTASGEFIFKLLLNHPLEDLQQEMIYLQRLKDHAYPAAYYLPSPHGPSFYQNQNILAVVQRKQAGHIPERSAAVNREFGLHLARLHLLPTHALPDKHSWMNANYLPEALKVAQQSDDHQATDRFLQAYEQVRHFQPATLPQTIIHGDATLYNSLFIGNHLCALLDWEEVTIGAPLLDIAMAILMFCFVKRIFQPSLFASFMDGYMQFRPLIQDEQEQLEIAVRYAALMVSTYFLLQSLQDHAATSAKDLQEFYWSLDFDPWTWQ